jgi:Winged helix DNA-binding domain
VKRARTEERSLLRTWLMRMTIHLIPSDEAAWWLPLFEPKTESWSRRRLEQLGLPRGRQDRALAVIGRALADEGPLTRPELRERVVAAGVPLDQQTGMHIALVAVVSGVACLGPDRGASTCLVRREDWLGTLRKIDRVAALAELARRYLGAFGPATDRDFAYWAGLRLGEVRAGLERISSEVAQFRVRGETMLTLRGDLPRLPRRGQVRMLGNFDTYLLGWKDRGFALSERHAARVKEGGGGWIRPVIVEDGIVVGGWRSARRAGRIEVSLELPAAERARLGDALAAEIDDIARFEGLPVERLD